MKKTLLTIVLAIALSMTVVAIFAGCDLFSGGNGDNGALVANYDHFYIEDNEVVGLTELGLQQTILVVPASITSINRNATATTPSPFRHLVVEHMFTVKFEANSNLEIIGTNAFFGVHHLESITIPSSVTTIRLRAFNSARGLRTVNFESNSKLETIGESAFFDTPLLQSITIPASVRSIGTSAFAESMANPSQLHTVNFEENSQLTNIGSSAFRSSALENIALPSSVTMIGSGAFAGTALTSISIPPLVTSIAATLFANSSLVSITIPSTVIHIGAGAFRGATSLTSINIPFSVTEIGWEAFCGTTSLTSITIPASVAAMGVRVFQGWTAEQTIHIQGRTETELPSGFHSWLYGSSANIVWNA
ncbi:MAG: leucine-rich repeat domain-containing protein [Firmicutes bacterium]|nr:leucine-rich repeat domain-containing protein [Bacillota bacterium]